MMEAIAMQRVHYILATAGHVDHGKSALVKALTGTDPTRLPEEKARGITIDLGFARWERVHPARADVMLDVGVIDVPGHEDFVKNMVAGVGSIDLALLVVAADDGWMPQTEEHLQILQFLGVTRAVVVLSKADLVEDKDTVARELRRNLAGSVFSEAPIVPVSVVTGAGLDALRDALAGALVAGEPPADVGKPRLWVDRVLSLRGVGTVLTGTLSGGTLHRGDAVVVEPGCVAARIRAIQSHQNELDSAGPGRRIGLSLPDLSVGTRAKASTAIEGVRRGHVVTLPELAGASAVWDVQVTRSARSSLGAWAGPELMGKKGTVPRLLKTGTRVRVHHGSGQCVARLLLLGCAALGPGESGLAQLRFDSPQPAFLRDRFVLRDGTGQATLAGGVVLDPDANPRASRNAARLSRLERLAGSGLGIGTVVQALLEARTVMDRGTFMSRTPFSRAEIEAGLVEALSCGTAVACGPWIVAGAWWSGILRYALDALDAEHRDHPERIGLAVGQLRSVLRSRLPREEIFDSVVTSLQRSGVGLNGGFLHRLAHRPMLPPGLAGAGERIRARLALDPLEPPSRRDLVPDEAAQQALLFFIEAGQVVEIHDDLVMLPEHFVRATLLIKGHLRRHGTATVSELREVLQTSRRVIVPLLEKLDRDGVTVRDGDLRHLRPKGTAKDRTNHETHEKKTCPATNSGPLRS